MAVPVKETLRAEIAKFEKCALRISFKSRVSDELAGGVVPPFERLKSYTRNGNAVRVDEKLLFWTRQGAEDHFTAMEIVRCRAGSASVTISRDVSGRADALEGHEQRFSEWKEQGVLAELNLPLASDEVDQRTWSAVETEQLSFGRIGWHAGPSRPLKSWFRDDAKLVSIMEDPAVAGLWTAVSKTRYGQLSLTFTWDPFVIHRAVLELDASTHVRDNEVLSDRFLDFTGMSPTAPKGNLTKSVVTYKVDSWVQLANVHIPTKYQRSVLDTYQLGGTTDRRASIEMFDLKAESELVDDGRFHLSEYITDAAAIDVDGQGPLQFVFLDGKVVPQVDSAIVEHFANPPLFKRSGTWMVLSGCVIVMAAAAYLYLRRA
jgi:hypothetical protein